MCILPARLREPVCLAYLLARLSDSIADCAAVPGALRLESLEKFRIDPRGWSPGPFAQAFSPPERALAEALPVLLDALEQSPDRDLIDETLALIRRGQMADARRAAEGSEAQALPWENVLEYSFLVAGCVGEFWIRIAARHIPSVFVHPPDARRLEDARAYGIALQLVNILRDAPADASGGRVYLAEADRDRAVETIRSGLGAASRLLRNIRAGRFYPATALPAQIAARMLPGLSSGGGKIRRAEVCWLALLSLLKTGPVHHPVQ